MRIKIFDSLDQNNSFFLLRVRDHLQLITNPNGMKAMSLTLGRKAANRPLNSVSGRFWQAVRDRYVRMATANRLKRELATMDARMLSDIGVSRAQLHFTVEEWERDPR
jgi:uncharacterized protein YjiS (DUF1127 family)